MDAEILKSLNLDNLLEEKKQQERQADGAATTMIDTTGGSAYASDPMMNKTMTELRMEHGMEPGLHSAASKLRQRCAYYQEKYSADDQP